MTYGLPTGFGLAQTDPAIFPSQFWNWQASILGGIKKFKAALSSARTWQGREQSMLDTRLTAAWNAANANRVKMGLPKLPPMKPLNIKETDPFTDRQVLRDAIRQYNGGHDYHFDFDYFLSANGIDVDHAGSER